jgi:hypothetical protein
METDLNMKPSDVPSPGCDYSQRHVVSTDQGFTKVVLGHMANYNNMSEADKNRTILIKGSLG